MQISLRYISQFFVLALVVALACSSPATATTESLLRSVLRQSGDFARVSSDQLDNFARSVSRNGGDLARALGRRTEDLIRSFRSAADPALLRQFDGLTRQSDRALIATADSAGRVFQDAIPDMARRWRLMEAGGAEGLVLAARRGQQGARALDYVSESVQAGRFGDSSVTIQGAASTLGNLSDGAWQTFSQYILPNWRTLLGAGVVGYVLMEPEHAFDTAGRLLEPVAREIIAAGVAVPASAISMVGEAVIEETGEALASPRLRWAFAIGLVVLLMGPFLVRFGWRKLRSTWLNMERKP